MLKMLNRPMVRWQGLALAVLFVVSVWQFGHYLDHRRVISDMRTERSTSQLEIANKQLVATAKAQRRQNIADAHLRNAVCTIFVGIPAPSQHTKFGKLWRHAIHEADCGETITVHKVKPKAYPASHPVVTVTVTPRPTQAATGGPHPKPVHHHHRKAHPTPSPTCLLPTGMIVPCVTPPALAEADA